MKNFSKEKLVQLIEHYHLYNLLYIFLILLLLTISFIPGVPHRFQLLVLALVWIPVMWEAIKDLKEKKLGSEIFFVMATVVALLGDEERAMTIVLLVVMIANYLEKIVEERTEHAIESLISLIPESVILQRDHQQKIVPISEVVPGMDILIKTGSRIAADGLIIDGEASVNEAPLTGESQLI